MAKLTSEQVADIVMGDDKRITTPIAETVRTSFPGNNWLCPPLKQMWKSTNESPTSLAQSNRELAKIGLQTPQLTMLYSLYFTILKAELESLTNLIKDRAIDGTLCNTDDLNKEKMAIGEIKVNAPVSNLSLGFSFEATAQKVDMNLGGIYEEAKKNIRSALVLGLNKNPMLTMTSGSLPPEIK